MSTPPESSPRQPMRLIGQVSRSFLRLADTPLRELGFTVSQLPVLVSLKHAGTLSQSELARLARVEQPSMAQLLSRMERDGLVQRVADPADGRSRLVSLSAQASRKLPEARRVMDGLCNLALDGLKDDEQVLLLTLLAKIDANLNEALDQLLEPGQ